MTTARPLPPPEEVTLTFHPGGRPLKIRRWMAEEWREKTTDETADTSLKDGTYIQCPDKWRRIVAAAQAAGKAEWELNQLVKAHGGSPKFRPMPKGPN